MASATCFLCFYNLDVPKAFSTWVPSSQKPLVLLHASGSDVKGSTQDSGFSSLEPHNAPPTRPPGLFLPSGRSDL